MTFLSQTLPVVLAVAVALTIALLFSRSLLFLLFGAMRRMGMSQQADSPSEQGTLLRVR